MKLSEFYDNVVGDNPFIFSAQFENAEYMQEYYQNSNFLQLDFNNCKLLFGDLQMDSNITRYNDLIRACGGVFLANDFKYRKLYNTLKTYDFMENMNLTRTRTETHGERVSSDSYGTKEQTFDHGANTTTNVLGESTNTETIGATKETATHGEKSVTNVKGEMVNSE